MTSGLRWKRTIFFALGLVLSIPDMYGSWDLGLTDVVDRHFGSLLGLLLAFDGR